MIDNEPLINNLSLFCSASLVKLFKAQNRPTPKTIYKKSNTYKHSMSLIISRIKTDLVSSSTILLEIY